jgi:hypothetical protein
MERKIGFTIGGIQFFLSKEEVEGNLKGVEPENVREVYVEVDGKEYPIKQAFAASTGLLRGGFTTHDAMRVFRKLSLPVGTRVDLDTLPERYYAGLKNLHDLDKGEIRGVVRGLVNTEREKCFFMNYVRGTLHVETLLSLKRSQDLQAMAMVARGLFELAVDTKLIDAIPDAVKKIHAFPRVEKLRAAQKIVDFKAANPAATVDASVHETFITNNAHSIEAERKAVWPDLKKVEHWSGLKLPGRVALLKAPFDEMYAVEYPEMSWYVHPGPTGFVNLPARTFNLEAGKQNKLAGECFSILLTAVIEEFGIERSDAKIKNKLKRARLLPFTDSADEAAAVEAALLA